MILHNNLPFMIMLIKVKLKHKILKQKIVKIEHQTPIQKDFQI